MKTFFGACIVSILLGIPATAQETRQPDSAASAGTALNLAKIDAFMRDRESEKAQSRLSTLWTVVSLNMIGADVLSSYVPGTQDEIEKYAGGKKYSYRF